MEIDGAVGDLADEQIEAVHVRLYFLTVLHLQIEEIDH